MTVVAFVGKLSALEAVNELHKLKIFVRLY
jgi:hypothetical protein